MGVALGGGVNPQAGSLCLLLTQVFSKAYVTSSVATQVCLELLIALALRNRDRIVLIWPLIHEYLNAVMAPSGAKAANPLTARVSSLRNIC